MNVQQRVQVDGSTSLSLDDRSFDLVLLSNWEDQIIYEPDQDNDMLSTQNKDDTATAINQALESGIWTQSIIWDSKTPFRDFTQIEFNHEDDPVPEERQSGGWCSGFET
jgi:transcription initiation factor TFIID subunit 1